MKSRSSAKAAKVRRTADEGATSSLISMEGINGGSSASPELVPCQAICGKGSPQASSED